MQLQTQEKANLKQPSNTLHADPTDHSCQAHQQSQSNCSMQPQTRRPKTASKARLELRGSENSRPNPGDHPPGSNSIMVRPIMEGIPRVQPTTPAPSHLRSTGPAVRKPRARSKTVRSHPPGQRQRELKTRAAQPTLDAQKPNYTRRRFKDRRPWASETTPRKGCCGLRAAACSIHRSGHNFKPTKSASISQNCALATRAAMMQAT